METAQDWEHTAEAEGQFASIAGTLQEESERLIAVAEACRAKAEDLAEREAGFAARERSLDEAQRELERRSDEAGNATPRYDFCYLDGAKNFNIDGLAVVLVEKLLKPGGWLLMDDLEWTYRDNQWIVPAGDGHPLGPLSESELTQPHLRAVFELIVKQHPSFTRFRREDEWYGWAQKLPGSERRYELASSRPLSAVLMAELRRRRRSARRRP